jgi:starvation-inducible DNA-binding protein
MYQTKNDLPAHARADVIVILNARLADSIDLTHQAKQAHWNVKGPRFMALHKLFDEVVDAAEAYMDLSAERIVQLGGTKVELALPCHALTSRNFGELLLGDRGRGGMLWKLHRILVQGLAKLIGIYV